jgi:hypothetical protein
MGSHLRDRGQTELAEKWELTIDPGANLHNSANAR